MQFLGFFPFCERFETLPADTEPLFLERIIHKFSIRRARRMSHGVARATLLGVT